ALLWARRPEGQPGVAQSIQAFEARLQLFVQRRAHAIGRHDPSIDQVLADAVMVLRRVAPACGDVDIEQLAELRARGARLDAGDGTFDEDHPVDATAGRPTELDQFERAGDACPEEGSEYV